MTFAWSLVYFGVSSAVRGKCESFFKTGYLSFILAKLDTTNKQLWWVDGLPSRSKLPCPAWPGELSFDFLQDIEGGHPGCTWTLSCDVLYWDSYWVVLNQAASRAIYNAKIRLKNVRELNNLNEEVGQFWLNFNSFLYYLLSK